MNFGLELPQMLGNYIKETRVKKHLKQNDIARIIKCSVQFYGRIENGYVMPPKESLVALIHLLELKKETIEKIFRLAAIGYVSDLYEISEGRKNKKLAKRA